MNQQPLPISNATSAPASHAELVRELHRLEAKLNAMRRWALGAVVLAGALGAVSFAAATPRSACFDSLTLRELHFVDAESSADPASPPAPQVTGLKDFACAKLVATDLEIRKENKSFAALRDVGGTGTLLLYEGGNVVMTYAGSNIKGTRDITIQAGDDLVINAEGDVTIKGSKIGQN